MNIVTGYKGQPHVTAQQDRNKNRGIFGSDSYRLIVGSNMAATIVSANEITIADGVVCVQGCIGEIPAGTSESLTIDNGAQGMQRLDRIVVRYTKDGSTGVEDMTLRVIKGTPAASNPALPAYTSGSIANGDAVVEVPLYTVTINGLAITSVSLVMAGMWPMSKMGAGNLLTTATNVIGAINELFNKIGTTAMGTTATTVTGAIKELRDKLAGNFQLNGRLLSKNGSTSIATFAHEAKYQDNITIQAGASTSVTFSIAKTGYTPFAASGVRVNNASQNGANSSYCFVYSWYFDVANRTCTVGIRNTNELAVAAVRVQMEVAYIATSAV